MSENQTESCCAVALITGGAQRIGAACAERLHREGFNVVIHYRNSSDSAVALAKKLNQIRSGSAAVVAADFEKPDSGEKLIAYCIDEFGRLDVLVNNASEFFPTPIGSISINEVSTLFSVNVFAPLLLAQAAWPYLQKHSGSVVNIVDVYASIVHKDHAAYCSSKAALLMLTKSLAVEFAPGVRVNGIAPGAILWPEGDAATSLQQKEKVMAKIPMKRMGSPELIASAVAFLCSDEAAFTTGQILNVDGGRTL